MWQDLRYALRLLRRTPGFTAVALLSLGLGIGANTAIFTLIDAVMLRTLPVRAPGELVELLQHYPGEPRGNGYFTQADYEHYRDHNHVFSVLIAYSGPAAMPVRGDGSEAETANVALVAGDYFSDLGVTPAMGRAPGAEDSAVISWAWWNDHFGRSPSILGRRLVVGSQPVTVVGVAPKDFQGLETGVHTDLWLGRPVASRAGLALLGRLRPGVSIDQARAEMSVLYGFTIERRVQSSRDPLVHQLKLELEPAGRGLARLRDLFARPLVLLMVVVGLLLLIACTNLASLLLARAAARRHEMAFRIALGASRLRLVRQALTESLLLSAAGSVFGLLLAYFGAGALLHILTSGRPVPGLPQKLDIPLRPEAHVLIFTMGIALLTGLLFGAAPAWQAFRSSPATFLRGAETRSRRIFGRSLVVAQVALSVVLLSAAALFLRHLSNLEDVDLGFHRDHVLLVSLDRAVDPAAGRQLLDRLQSVPGVRSATVASPTPLSGAGASGFATVDGYLERPEDRRYNQIAWIAPRYFETLGIAILAGRDFDFGDDARPNIAIISQAMARTFFAGRSPIGQHLTLDHMTGSPEPHAYEIIGVAADANYYEIRQPVRRTVYLPAFHEGRVSARTLILRTAIRPESVARDVRKSLQPLAISRITTLSEQVDATIVPERLLAALSGVFGGLGAMLAAIGLYGLLAYTVARRRNEIGIRMALGATRAVVIRMVLVDALAMVSAGLLAGAPLALWGKRFATAWVTDAPPAISIVTSCLAMLAVAVVAAWLPARRAAAIDPVRALRYE